ncbi:MAG: hypothetical protein KDA59_22875 [Planctomycetales bacterium]|nr:hypothetical protein [Planctomycetales bacterium]
MNGPTNDRLHTIRLRGPWQYEPLARTVWTADGESAELTDGSSEHAALPPAGRVTMPCDWSESLGTDFRGRVRFIRYFNRPTGLDSATRVYLAIDEVDAMAEVQLNGHKLGQIRGADGTWRSEVTPILETRNALEIVVDLPSLSQTSAPLPRPRDAHLAGGVTGEVRLEILAPAS